MNRINVRLDPELKERLDSVARAEGVSPSELIRVALKEHLDAKTPEPSCLDLAKKIGIVGIYKDAPFDLSINPAHMGIFKDWLLFVKYKR